MPADALAGKSRVSSNDPAVEQQTRVTFPDSKVGWPYLRITYKAMNPRIARYARWAARTWNRANVRYKFVRVKKKSQAQLLVLNSGSCGSGRMEGGFGGDHSPSGIWTSGCGSRVQDQRLAAKFFGYVLGLGSNGKCGLMSSYCGLNVRRPTADERRRVRRMARARNRVMRSAPKTPALSILKRGDIYVDYEGGFGGLGPVVDFKLGLTAAPSHLTWTSFRAYVEPVAIAGDPDPESGDFDRVDCEIDFYGDIWSFEDVYGPWGSIGSWRAAEWFSCPFGGELGTYRLRVQARSAKGLLLRAEETFDVVELIEPEE